jgi:hypothetical protein
VVVELLVKGEQLLGVHHSPQIAALDSSRLGVDVEALFVSGAMHQRAG